MQSLTGLACGGLSDRLDSVHHVTRSGVCTGGGSGLPAAPVPVLDVHDLRVDRVRRRAVLDAQVPERERSVDAVDTLQKVCVHVVEQHRQNLVPVLIVAQAQHAALQVCLDAQLDCLGGEIRDLGVERRTSVLVPSNRVVELLALGVIERGLVRILRPLALSLIHI